MEIAFIVCTNNKKYMEECKFYIEKLYVPDGMEVSVIPIENPRSMTIGYNKAMKASSARYKVYLHQDMFIVNRNFIFDIADCFESDSNIGMIGVAGIRKLRDASVWNSLDIGGCYSVGTFSGVGSIAVKPQINNPDSMYQEVDYIDGMLMASQYDIEWDEKIEGFHFYDVSQCERFRKSGYKVVVAKQDEIWTFHDFGPLNLKTYRNNQKKFCELYGYNVEDDQDNTAVYELCETVAVALKPMFESRDFEKIGKVINDVGSAIYFNQDLLTVWFLMEVYLLENKTGVDILANIPITDGVFVYLERKWMILRLLLIRMIFDYSRAEEITKLIAEGEYSIVAVIIAALHNIPSENFNVLDAIGRKLGEEYGVTEDIWIGAIMLVTEWEKTHQPSVEGL